MRRILIVSLATASVAVGGVIAPSAASAASTSAITIDFESDTVGAKANGFAPVGTSGVVFNDTKDANLQVGDFGNQSHGKALAAGPDDDSAVEIQLAHPTISLSLAFGNDQPGTATAVDQAVLTVFRGGTKVGQRSVTLNANDVMDQTIKFDSGVLFNRARFQYVAQAGTPLNLIEAVDDIKISPLCTVAGTQGNDILNGTGSTDVICGGGGNDTINGFAGSDLVFGGGGNDTVSGGRGNDTINGGSGRDRLLGNNGADTLRGLKGRDRLEGGNGSDRCEGGPDRDSSSSCESKSSIP